MSYQGVLKSFQEREGVLISRETLDGASIGGGKTQTIAKTTLLADPLHLFPPNEPTLLHDGRNVNMHKT